MKKSNIQKAPLYMSRSAFQAHAHRQTHKLKMAFGFHETDAAEIAKAVYQNPLGLVSTIGLYSDLDEEDIMSMSVATLKFEEQFGKFKNLDTDRYMSVLLFIAEHDTHLKSDVERTARIKNDCYEWLYSGADASINAELKRLLTQTLTHSKSIAEREKLTTGVPALCKKRHANAAFKI